MRNLLRLSMLLCWIGAYSPQRAPAQCCDVTMVIESQWAATNAVKIGTPDLYTQAGRPHYPPQYFRKVIETEDFTFSDGTYGGQWNTSQTDTWAKPATGECPGGAVGVHSVSGFGSVSHNCDNVLCSATWTPQTGWSDLGSCMGARCHPNGYECDEVIDLPEHYRSDTCHDDDLIMGTHEIIMEEEYTTAMLIADWEQELQSAPWSEWGFGDASACRDLLEQEKCIHGWKMKYRIRYIGPPCEQGELVWIERFMPRNGPTVDKTNRMTVTFTGLEQITDEFTVDPPKQDGCIFVMSCGGGGGCSTCSYGDAEIDGCAPNPQFPLSPDRLYINPQAPLADLPTPAALGVFKATASTVVVLDGNNHVRQARSDHGVADVEITSPTSYVINFWSPASEPVEGVYPTNGLNNMASWTVQKINETPFTLRLARQNGPTIDYIYQNNNWTTREGGGLRERTDQVVRNGASQITSHTITIQPAGGPAVYQRSKTYLELTGKPPVIFREILGQGADSVTNRWFYFDDLAPTHINYGKLKLKVEGNGGWERYEYDNVTGLLTKKITTFVNGATNALESDSRVFEYSYTPVHPNDAVGTWPNTPRRVIEKLKGNEISRTYTAMLTQHRLDVRCASPANPTWDAPGNLITTNRGTATLNMAGSIVAMTYRTGFPDGTVLIVTEQMNGTAVTERTITSGQPHSDPQNLSIVAGTETWTSLRSDGQIGSRYVTEFNPSGSLTVVNETYQYDSSDRLRFITDSLQSTVTENQYDCCHLRETIDEEGVVTGYTYDALDRLLTTTRDGVTISNVYDAAGNVLETWRFGTDPNQQGIKISSTTYNLGGRIKTSRDAMNNLTTYTYIMATPGYSLNRTTYANNALRDEYINRDGSVWRVIGSAVPTVEIFDYGIELEGGVQRAFVKETRAATTEWTKTYSDFLGRPYKTIYAVASGGNPAQQSFFNSKGQLWKQVDPDGVVTVFAYNGRGELEETAIDVDRDNQIDKGDQDRITRVVRDLGTREGYNILRTRTSVWNQNGADQSVDVSIQETALNHSQGTLSWNTRNGLTTRTLVEFLGSGARRETVTAPDLSYNRSDFQNGRLTAVNRYDANNNPVGQMTYAPDLHRRVLTETDVRTGTTTTYSYNNSDQPLTITVAASGLPQQLTTHYYDNMAHVWRTTLPDNSNVTNEFHLTGLLKKTYGSRTYPVEYTYSGGRISTMKTWQDFAAGAGAATTTWKYDGYRGFLTNKVYADNTGPAYTYTPGGRLKTRTWARGTPNRIVTTYSYGFDDGINGNDHADLLVTTYSNDPQNTPSVTYTRDRRGRVATVTSAGATTTLTYNNAGEMATESYAGGSLNGHTLTIGFDALLRRHTLSLNTQPSSLNYSYLHDAASRLHTVIAGSHSFGYSYLANSPLLQHLYFTNGTVRRMTTTRAYDNLNRLRIIESTVGGSPVSSFTYTYNLANQRTNVAFHDSGSWEYKYDDLGQVTSAKRYFSAGVPLFGQQFEYGFDDIGNRKFDGRGGNEWGQLRYATYSANNLNQYTQRLNPPAVDITGAVDQDATATVNDQPTLRQGEYYWAEVPLNNISGPVYLSVTNSAVIQTEPEDLITEIEGKLLVPKAQETFAHDLDGNLTADSLWNYIWDAENRLMKMTSAAGLPLTAERRLEFEYDWKHRRIRKRVHDRVIGGVQILDEKYIWDGWNLIAILNGTNNNLIRSFVWGIDLSGTLQGAGGVGGLLAINETAQGVHFPAYDANGNVTGLVKASDGSSGALYEYSAFGETIRATGPVAKANPFRFSTKFTDEDSGLIYYPYRYYRPTTGKWLNPDPLGEAGHEQSLQLTVSPPSRLVRDPGPQLSYVFCNNDPLSIIDVDGRECKVPPTLKNWRRVAQPILAIGVIIADNYLLHKACCCLQNNGDETFIQTPGTKILSGTVFLPLIGVTCPNGGLIYYRVWRIHSAGCDHELVIFCFGGSGSQTI